MESILNFLKLNFMYFLVYIGVVVVAFVVLYFLSKHKTKSIVILQALIIIKTFMYASLGPKAAELIDIWIEGIQMIQDGEFSQEDGIEQFVRYVKLAATSKGVNLSDTETDALRTLAETTLKVFVGKKKSEVVAAVKAFNSPNYK
jgi:hypothetical protein